MAKPMVQLLKGFETALKKEILTDYRLKDYSMGRARARPRVVKYLEFLMERMMESPMATR